MSLMMLRRCCPEARMWRRKLACFGSTLPSRRSTRISEKPMIEFIGVRSSCDMFARNWLFSRFASWMRRLASATSRERCWSSPVSRVSSLTWRLSSASSWRMRSRFSCRLATPTRKKYDAPKRKSMREKARVKALSKRRICPITTRTERRGGGGRRGVGGAKRRVLGGGEGGDGGRRGRKVLSGGGKPENPPPRGGGEGAGGGGRGGATRGSLRPSPGATRHPLPASG